MGDVLLFQIFELIIVIFNMFIMQQFINIFFERRVNKRFFIIGYLVYGVGSGILSLFYAQHIRILLAYTILGFLILELLLYYGNTTSKVFIALFFGVLVLTTEIVFASLYLRLNRINIDNSHEYSMERVLVATLLSLTQLLAVKIISIVVTWNKSERDIISLKNVFSLLVAQVFSIFMLHHVFVAALHNDGKLSLSIILYTLAVIYINFILFWHFERVKLTYKHEHEKEMIETQLAYQKKHFKLLELQQRENEALWHDMRKHLLSIKELYSMGMQSNVEEYIVAVENSIDSLPNIKRTGVPAINAILADELRRAQEKNIEILLDINMPYDININPFDLCVMIGNTVENAIDACSALPDSDERKIEIKILQDNTMLLIEVTNTYNKDAGSVSRTGRKNGYGLINIHNTAKKHNGYVNIDDTGSIFQISIIIPCTS